MAKNILSFFLFAMIMACLYCSSGNIYPANILADSVNAADDAVLDTNHTTLHISVGRNNKVSIPDPAMAGNDVQITLRAQGTYQSLKSAKQRKLYFTDLSFAGFKKEVMVTSFAVGSVAKKDSSTAQIRYVDAEEENMAYGNCLALFVTAGTDKTQDYVERKSYLLLIDYASGNYYKIKTDFWLESLSSFNTLKLTDLTGDGLDELIIKKRHNKWIDFEIYRCDAESGELKMLHSFLKTDDRDLFSGHLEDNYQVVLEYKDINFSQTVSLLDAGFLKKDLDVATLEKKYVLKKGEWYDKITGEWHFDDTWPARCWKNKKLLKKNKGDVFLYLPSFNDVKVEKSEDGIPQLKLHRYVEIGHRSMSFGDMYVYFQYDEEQDKMVLADAKFEIEEKIRWWD